MTVSVSFYGAQVYRLAQRTILAASQNAADVTLKIHVRITYVMPRTASIDVAAMMFGGFIATAPISASNANQDAGNSLFSALETCLTIRNDAARLACTDVAARNLVDAEHARDIVVVDREGARRTRRSLFGISLGSRDPITGRDDPAERVDLLDTTIAGVRPTANGRWLMTLAEGGRWQTSEPWDGGAVPRVGASVVVRRGTLGNYTLKMMGARVVRVQRLN